MIFHEELREEPIFMGFDIKPAKDGNPFNDAKQPIGVDGIKGVAVADLQSRLGTYEQAKALNLPFVGISLMQPIVIDGYQLVCIDADWKRSPDLKPKPEQVRLMDCLSRMSAAYEESYSGHGYHFFVKVPEGSTIPRTVDLGDDCQIEIFCGNQSQRANILLTDKEAFGQLIEVNLMELFEQLGIEAVVSTSHQIQDGSLDFDHEIAKASFDDRELEILKSAIAALPPAQDYHEWYTTIGLALKSVKGAAGGRYDTDLLDLWDEYSQKNPQKYTAKSTLDKWNLPEKNIRSTLGTIYYHATNAGWIRPRPIATMQITEYIRDKKGAIEANQQNMMLFLKRYQLRYDEFRAAHMGVFNGLIENLVDEHITQIQLDAEIEGFKRLATAFVRENVLFVARNNSFDSAIEWGNSLVWDGIPRCSALLSTYFGAPDNEYTRAASQYITSAMGGRLIEPGCKADAAIVLIGKQGAGKSTSIAALSPLEDAFVEINLSDRNADLSRQLRGKLVGEIAELRGLQSKEAEDIKAFLSRTFENWVPKYKEFETTFKRRLTFWGTSNEREFLSDHTGNRRWLPVEITNPDADLVKRDRDQIWAEAICIYKSSGIQWEEVQKLAPLVHAEHIYIDPVRVDVEAWLIRKNSNEPITTRNYHNSTPRAIMELTTKESRAVGRALTALGYKARNQRIDGVVQKVYYKEQDE